MCLTEETDRRCVVCQGKIVQRTWTEVKPVRSDDMSNPIGGTVAYPSVKRVEGYHCSACGLEYYKLPPGIR